MGIVNKKGHRDAKLLIRENMVNINALNDYTVSISWQTIIHQSMACKVSSCLLHLFFRVINEAFECQ